MRPTIYAIAILAAAGIMYVIATQPTRPPTDESATNADVQTSVADSKTIDASDVASLTMNVPDMHCPVACYPAIKSHLEKSDAVVSVDLAPQKEEGVIDNPQIIVKHRSEFDPGQAIASLETLGFKNSTVVE